MMGALRVEVVADHAELSRVGADLVADLLSSNPAAAVVAATGRTPMGLYAQLAERKADGFDCGSTSVFQLDEYLGIEPDDRRSLAGWLRRSFLEPLGIGDGRVALLPTRGDLAHACTAFDNEIEERGGLDLAILGLGPNGHLGFNEPPSDADAPTRVVSLSPSSIEASAGYWGTPREVPPTAVTMGMRQLLVARTILLVVSGANKNGITRRALEGPVCPEVPASFLQRASGDVVAVVDREAWG